MIFSVKMKSASIGFELELGLSRSGLYQLSLDVLVDVGSGSPNN